MSKEGGEISRDRQPIRFVESTRLPEDGSFSSHIASEMNSLTQGPLKREEPPKGSERGRRKRGERDRRNRGKGEMG